MTIPTMSASIAWRLGIAAYGFAANAIRPLSWLIDEYWQSVSTKPHSGNIRGGAVGHEDVADEADEVRGDQPVAEAREALVVPEVDPQQRRTHDGELRKPVRVRRQRDHDRRGVDDALDRRLEERAEVRSVRSTDSPFWNARATLRSAAPRAIWYTT